MSEQCIGMILLIKYARQGYLIQVCPQFYGYPDGVTLFLVEQ